MVVLSTAARTGITARIARANSLRMVFMITYRIMIKFPVWCVAAVLLAQETPTEREAAREVLRKMGALEKSLDVPGGVSKLAAANADREGGVARAKQLMGQEFL